jgi:beta-1,4-mannosyltransferase
VTTSALPSLRPDRPAVLVSSTSWTEDEDFSILLDALSIYEKRARAASGGLPHVLMFVTGKGPLLEPYMRKVRGLQDGEDGKEDTWQWVRIVSTWLEPSDYPLLLGAHSPRLPHITMLNESNGLRAQGQQTWAFRCIRVLQH